MTNLSDLPAEVLREILIHAVNVRGLKRGLRLRLVNKEFSQEVKSALYQSHAPGDYLQEWHPVRPELESEFDAFWHPYLTNKIIQKKWDDGSLSERIHRTTGRVTPHITIFVRGIGHRLMSRDEERRKERLCEIALCGGIYRAAERLCQISHPEEGSKETLYEVLKQYIYTFCSHPRRILARARFSSRRTKTCPFSDSLYFLEMALANDCHKGIRSALNDPAVEDMLSHSLERPCVYQCEHYITTSSAERGNMVFLAKIFANPTFQQKRKRIQSVAFNAAVRECRLDVVRFIMEPREHWSDVELIVNLNEDAIRCGVLKSRSVDFCFQLFGLLASRLRIPTVSAKHGPDTYNRHRLWEHLRYDNVLCIVASGSPQRADVAQWLLDHGASVSLTAEEEEILVKSTRRVYRSPLERAVKGGNEKIVRLLLDHGAGLKDVEATYYYAEAARQGRLDMIRILVEYGARVATRLPRTCRSLHWRCSLMMYAVPTENEGLCRYLAEHGTCVNDAAMNAAIEGSLMSMVQLLLKLGAVVTEHTIDKAKLCAAVVHGRRTTGRVSNPHDPYAKRGSQIGSSEKRRRSKIVALLQAHKDSN